MALLGRRVLFSKSSSILSFVIVLVNLSLLELCHSSRHKYGDEISRSGMFIFGDSIFDAGNNNYINTTNLDKANFFPYGITFFHHPTGRFSDGRLIPDFIGEHANLGLIPPYLQPGNPGFYDGVNFASAGGGALVETFQGSVIDLHMQLRNYKKAEKWLRSKLGKRKAKKRIKKGVYLFSIGSNDYMSLYLTNSTFLTTYTPSQYVDLVIANISSVITEIYKSGGRKFAFLNVPPLGCTPNFRATNFNITGTDTCFKEVSNYVVFHNKALIQLMKQLAKKLPNFKYSIYDFYTSSLQRLNQPSLYGYKEVKTACCGTGKFRGVFSCGGTRLVKEYEICKNIGEHVFWDSFHMTEKFYHQIAEEMWYNTNNAILHHSYSIKDLFYLP